MLRGAHSIDTKWRREAALRALAKHQAKVNAQASHINMPGCLIAARVQAVDTEAKRWLEQQASASAPCGAGTGKDGR